MGQLQHNVLNIFYVIKGMAEAHLAQVDEGYFDNREERLIHAEKILKSAYLKARQGLKITKRIRQVVSGMAHEDNSLQSEAGLKETWSRVRRILQREFPFDSIEILDRIPDDFPAICCEGGEFQEILYHLCKNALQAIAFNGKLILRAQIACSAEGEHRATITLADTGPGIETAALRCLFRPFFSTKPAEEGSGLGLYLTQGLVSKNRGRIAVSSFRGSGTTIALEFRIKPAI
ncbi:MAG: sensor histidine kinase [Candidatus Omnitrophota bacterium]|nr:sensor histidine kinase [Candidatus Omnitrophota bacterium]